METIKFTCKFDESFDSTYTPFIEVFAEYKGKPSKMVSLSIIELWDLSFLDIDSICDKVRSSVKRSKTLNKQFKTDVLKAMNDENHQLELAVSNGITKAIQLEIPRLEKKMEKTASIKAELEEALVKMERYKVKLPVAYWMSIPFEISMHGETLWVGRHTSEFDLKNGAATISQLCKKLSVVIFPDRIEDITSEALRVITWFDNSEHAPILVHPNIEVTRCTQLGAEGKFVSMYAMMRDSSVNMMTIVKISLNEGGTMNTKIYTRQELECLDKDEREYMKIVLSKYDELIKSISKQ